MTPTLDRSEGINICPTAGITLDTLEPDSRSSASGAPAELAGMVLPTAIDVAVQLLAITAPGALDHGRRLKHLVTAVLDEIGRPDLWEVPVAALLVGTGAAPADGPADSDPPDGGSAPLGAEVAVALDRALAGVPGSALLRNTVRHVFRPADETPQGLGVQLLRVVVAFERLRTGGLPAAGAIGRLRLRDDQFDRALVDALARVVANASRERTVEVNLDNAEIGMVLAFDVHTTTGTKLLNHGQQLTPALLDRLRSHASSEQGVEEPIRVLPPNATAVSDQPEPPGAQGERPARG